MSDTPRRDPLTIEDLLHLKRAERPAPEFWTRFESELRQKQLAALLQHRPWWQSLPQSLLQRRMFLPLGATALLAFTLVSVRVYLPGDVARVTNPGAAQPASPARVASLATPAGPRPDESVSHATLEESVQAEPAVAVAQLSETLPERTAELTPWSAPLPEQSPSAKSVAAKMAQLAQIEPGFAQALYGNSKTTMPSRVQHSDGATVELASASAMVSKRTRLLAQLDNRRFVQDPQAPEIVRERLARRLADTDFTERFSRVGLNGTQVSLKF